VNLSRSYYRRRKVERTYLERHPPAGPGADSAPVADLGDRDALWRALAGLPQRQRAALVLRFYEDLSERQIADVLRCPIGTVKSLVSRGLSTLRNRMDGEER
jgi:RNA polymerase sigma factor (sigma-70 family)